MGARDGVPGQDVSGAGAPGNRAQIGAGANEF